jgi:hypothetical protein
MISLPAPIIGISIIVLCTVGAYANRGTMFDVGVLLVFGGLGLLVRRFGYSGPTIVLGAILGPIIERNLRLSLILSNDSPVTFLTHPISLALLLAAVALMGVVAATKRSSRAVARRASAAGKTARSGDTETPQDLPDEAATDGDGASAAAEPKSEQAGIAVATTANTDTSREGVTR